MKHRTVNLKRVPDAVLGASLPCVLNRFHLADDEADDSANAFLEYRQRSVVDKVR